ncbi:MAG: GFA family protein [Betaproteobacteria bacterium]|nr:GFA family protein [Betaproteobacteria bacterium]
MTSSLTGSCLCGAIRYTVDVPIAELRACHCTNCQKASGAGGSVNAVIPAAALRFAQGAPKRHTGVADSGRTLHRYFCGDCGSPIYSQRDSAPETVVLRAGTLDNAGEMRIVSHIWTKSARPWSHIDPAAKRFPGQPDAPPSADRGPAVPSG